MSKLRIDSFIRIVSAIILFGLGGQFEVPIGPVPFILTDFFVFFMALSLSVNQFALAVVTYLLMGAVGLPVFSGGAGGFEHIIGNTAGYLIGYLLGGLIVSTIIKNCKKWYQKVILVFIGYYVLFILGVSWLAYNSGISVIDAFVLGAYPFILSMHLKASLAVVLYYGIKHIKN
ncbi:MAG: biotin transporter BioY [Bacteroidia bacterium]